MYDDSAVEVNLSKSRRHKHVTVAAFALCLLLCAVLAVVSPPTPALEEELLEDHDVVSRIDHLRQELRQDKQHKHQLQQQLRHKEALLEKNLHDSQSPMLSESESVRSARIHAAVRHSLFSRLGTTTLDEAVAGNTPSENGEEATAGNVDAPSTVESGAESVAGVNAPSTMESGGATTGNVDTPSTLEGGGEEATTRNADTAVTTVEKDTGFKEDPEVMINSATEKLINKLMAEEHAKDSKMDKSFDFQKYRDNLSKVEAQKLQEIEKTRRKENLNTLLNVQKEYVDVLTGAQTNETDAETAQHISNVNKMYHHLTEVAANIVAPPHYSHRSYHHHSHHRDSHGHHSYSSVEPNPSTDAEAVIAGSDHAGVFHISAKSGHFMLDYHEAVSACRAVGARLASPQQLLEAFQAGMQQCSAGWLSDKSTRFPMQTATLGCGEKEGVIDWGRPPLSTHRDAYCYHTEVKELLSVAGPTQTEQLEHLPEATGSEYTISVEFQLTSASGNVRGNIVRLSPEQPTGGTCDGVSLFVSETFRFMDICDRTPLDSKVSPEVGRWYSLTVAHDATTTRMYVDYELVASADLAGTEAEGPRVSIGGAESLWDVEIKNVAIFSGVKIPRRPTQDNQEQEAGAETQEQEASAETQDQEAGTEQGGQEASSGEAESPPSEDAPSQSSQLSQLRGSPYY